MKDRSKHLRDLPPYWLDTRPVGLRPIWRDQLAQWWGGPDGCFARCTLLAFAIGVCLGALAVLWLAVGR